MSIFSVTAMKKETGLTSFQSLSAVKRAVKGSKVGHTGTLDRFASGLMLVLTGDATKLNPLFTGFDKSYRALMVFGQETDTLDPEGEVVATSDRIPSLDEIEAVLDSFRGKIMQEPPVYSAIHVDGKRAYSEARKGREVEMPLREVEISALSIISYNPPYLMFDASVSKGTYIRSLARDIALSLSSRGRLCELERYRLGPFTYRNLTEIPAKPEETEANLSLVIPHRIDFRSGAMKSIGNGFFPEGAITDITAEGERFYRIYTEGRFVGVVERKEAGGYRIVCLSER